ncbi:unnamed protein product, partial [Scytosiphon promiscuus]
HGFRAFGGQSASVFQNNFTHRASGSHLTHLSEKTLIHGPSGRLRQLNRWPCLECGGTTLQRGFHETPEPRNPAAAFFLAIILGSYQHVLHCLFDGSRLCTQRSLQ